MHSSKEAKKEGAATKTYDELKGKKEKADPNWRAKALGRIEKHKEEKVSR